MYRNNEIFFYFGQVKNTFKLISTNTRIIRELITNLNKHQLQSPCNDETLKLFVFVTIANVCMHLCKKRTIANFSSFFLTKQKKVARMFIYGL